MLIAFVYRAIDYLDQKIQQFEVIKGFNEKYKQLLSEGAGKLMHYQKMNRNIQLFVAAYGYEGTVGLLDTNLTTISNIQHGLRTAYYKLIKYTSCPLFRDVKVKKNQVISFHETNILLNDKHYQSLRILWKEFDKCYKEKTYDEIIKYEQDIIRSIRSYALSLICYTCVNFLGYKGLMGNTHEWVSSHKHLPTIYVKLNKLGIIEMKIGNQKLALIVSCTDQSIDESVLGDNQFILAFGKGETTSKVIRIDVEDVDSTERIGTIIRKYIITQLIENIRKEYNVDTSHFTNVIDLLKRDFITPIVLNSYRYLSYPEIIDEDKFDIEYKSSPLTFEMQNRLYGKKKDRSEIYNITRERMHTAIKQINSNSSEFINTLKCPRCGKLYNKRDIMGLELFNCSNNECGFILDCSRKGVIIFHERYNTNRQIKNLQDYYGMDYIKVESQN